MYVIIKVWNFITQSFSGGVILYFPSSRAINAEYTLSQYTVNAYIQLYMNKAN